VGPNGCGKSNIVDAIRWSMGEQNPRHLRGRAMEDIIFAGTESKPAVGMAEVILTLDNSDGLAAPPYDGFGEIQVARRLYRSGESEYLINRTPVRLRDVTDFFLDTGVGARGYTIVEQGKVAEIVSTKPEERRIIFEEAAGIGKYRQRRRETERKLEATHQNLLRVTDILGELRRQINSLDRQARKATRYKELSGRQRDLELVVTWQDLQGDRQRIANAERELNEARTAGSALDARVARGEAQLESQRRGHLERERELQAQSERLYEIRNQIQALENQIGFERREREGLLRLTEERRGELGELETQLASRSGDLQDAVRELAGAEERLDQDATDLGERETQLRGEIERLAELQGRREALQARLVRLASEAATLESRSESLDDRGREIELRLRTSEEALESSSQEVEEIGREEAALEGRLRDALFEQDQMGRTLADLLRQHSETGTRRETRQVELAGTRERVQEARGRLEALLESEKRESARIAQALAALPEAERRRTRGVLSEVIRIEDGLEPALEAVLAGRLDAVLVEDAETALGFLAALRREKAGRATALPLAGGEPGLDTGIVPLGRPLLDFVTVDATHRPLVERLLRGVYVVDDLSEAVRRFGVADPPAIFVSREGELLDRTGALTGGSGAPAGSLSRQAEIRRLQEQLEVLERSVHDLEVAVAEESARVAELGRELDNARSRRHTAELAVVNLDKDLERSRERGKAVSEVVEQHRVGKAGLQDEIERMQRDSESARVRLESIGREGAEAETSRERLAGEASSLQRGLERVEQRLVQARVELAELGGRRDQLRETRDRLQEQTDEAREWIERRREEVARATERSESLQSSTAEAEVRLAEGIESEEELRLAQEAERARYEQSVRGLEGLETEVRTAQQEREQTRERIGQSELAVQEARMRRDQVCERILERYGVDLARYEPPAEHLEGDPEAREAELKRIRDTLQSMGEVHLGAIEEYEEVSERFRYLTEQKADLEESIEKLRSAISRINRTSRTRFRETFEKVNDEFQKIYPRVFRGGRAHLSLTETEDVLESGIEISAQPPGKKLQNVNLLSGGEKALTAIALLFAVFTVKPSPFFLLDEVDAALDDANVGRFDEVLRDIAQGSQFLIITHNKASIESADTLFGVTMQEPGLSKLVTVDLVS
jgi:chromosome segregation protein